MRVNITLACTECGERNYISKKNKRNNPERLELEVLAHALADRFRGLKPESALGALERRHHESGSGRLATLQRLRLGVDCRERTAGHCSEQQPDERSRVALPYLHCRFLRSVEHGTPHPDNRVHR